MISVILYGRNDNYGYNLHKRAALSINCISQVLTHDDDELLFVDYNSPDDFPTFPEAIQDTLTDHAKKRLRILRVRPWMHERFREKSHLIALEPIARNVAVRRSNPANRWVLSTNTDMIFVPHHEQSLSMYVDNLPRGLYHLPRFEIPETFWETFNRLEPEQTIDAIRTWSRVAHLNEIVAGAECIRFDAPGDFQLMDREDLFKIHAFHEGMLLGWHVDSNIAKRLNLFYGETKDLLDHVFGYHCDHTRQVTPMHRKDSVQNDIKTFIDDVLTPYIPEQADSWGLADVEVEEISLNHGRDRAYMAGISACIHTPQLVPTYSAYVRETYDKVTYSAAHVLPFLADIFVNAPPRISIGWVGSNPELFEMFSTIWSRIDDESRLLVFEPHCDTLGTKLAGEHVDSLEELNSQVDALIFDYNPFAADQDPNKAEKLLEAIRNSFLELVEFEQNHLNAGHLPRRFVVVNAIHNAFESITNHCLHTARTPFSSRIRQGFVVKRPAVSQEGTWLDFMRVGEAGMKQNKVISTAARKPGLVMYGPYLPISRGKFQVSLELACKRILRATQLRDRLKGHAKIKLVLGDQVIAKRRLSQQELFDGKVDIDFECEKSSSLEIRMWTSGSHDFEVRNIQTRRIDRSTEFQNPSTVESYATSGVKQRKLERMKIPGKTRSEVLPISIEATSVLDQPTEITFPESAPETHSERITAEHPSPPSFDVFLTPEALAINEARLCHLASLGLDLKNKRVLEVGGGIGLHTCFFESQGCDVLLAEARAENLDEAKRRYPHRKTALVNLDADSDLSHLGRFDVVYCYGTLDHLTNPSNALRRLAAICDGMILLETCVTPGDEEELHPEAEPASVVNQAFTGMGCRPTRSWVMSELRRHMGFAYQTVTQPNHHDFEQNWIAPSPRKLYRAVFVGAKSRLTNCQLSENPCLLQCAVPVTDRGTWLDVGAHLGETSFAKAEANPNLRVIAFEPNIALASQTFQRLQNFQILPIAIGEQTGLTEFHLNAFSAASSILPMDESARQQWIGGEVLSRATQIMVPVMRLDDVMNWLGIQHVDFLKIDAQGGDFSVVKSLGDRIKDVRKIKLEVTTTVQQLYIGAAIKHEIIAYLASRGFALVSEQSQTHGQEENLLFFQLDPWPQDECNASPLQSPQDEQVLRKTLLGMHPDHLVSLAQSQAAKSVIQRKSHWSFGSYADDRSLASCFRQILFSVFQERKLTKPLLFQWYDHLRLHLYLGNDMSLPTYVSGVIDPNEFFFLNAFLRKGMNFIDIGANEGFYSVFASDRVGEDGRVVAFEPSQREADRLLRNLELNEATNVTVEIKGVADIDGEAILKLCEYGHEGQNTLGGFAHKVNQDGTQTATLITLDCYFAAHTMDRIDLMKIDVEGAEERVLRGALETLKRFRPVLLMEMNDASLRLQGSSCSDVAELIESGEYCIYNFDSVTGKLVVAREGSYSDNVVAVPREKICLIEQIDGGHDGTIQKSPQCADEC
ncbi:MAG: FkbM family methyltransferase [Planctomycetes bacterium]|nr:FkbM family methyltransferase [Planctomycetota bacterium]